MKVLSWAGLTAGLPMSLFLVFWLLPLIAEGTSVSCQQKADGHRIDGNSVSIYPYSEIPEATEPCTQDECDWWKQIRKAGNELQKKSDKKVKAKFFLLLREGQQRGYRVPLKDRFPQSLAVGKLPSSDAVQNGGVAGQVAMSVEFRADGSVGDIQMIRRLSPAIDENVIRMIRECVFLPAIKNRAFVTSWRPAGAEFISHRRK